MKAVGGAEVAEKLLALVSVLGSRFGEDHLTWHCGDCDGLVLDRGPDAGNPRDAQPGHREDGGRLAAEVSRYVAGLDAGDQPASPRWWRTMSGNSRRGTHRSTRWSGTGAVVSRVHEKTHDSGVNVRDRLPAPRAQT